jgi:citrate/tricarballylate utilization protein
MAQIRLESYEQYAWPAPLARAFRVHGVGTSLVLSLALIGVMLLAAQVTGTTRPVGESSDFYRVLPHAVMVGLFGAVFTFVLVALAVGVARFRRDTRTPAGNGGPVVLWNAVRDALTLKNLHAHGSDCTHDEEARTPWRRWFHHCTFYGFGLCFAATSVAAVYHWLGWPAPYAYASVPVVLGTLGGFGLLIGPAGLYGIGRWRDPQAGDPLQQPLDRGFILLLFLTSLTGLLLLVLRETSAMPTLLIVHLGVVLAFFATMPYGKFVHGFYRTAALVQHHIESDHRAG